MTTKSAENFLTRLSRQQLSPDPRPLTELLSERPDASSLGPSISRRLPHLLQEKALKIGKTDKVFASQWITEDAVAVGTKCNKASAVAKEGNRTQTCLYSKYAVVYLEANAVTMKFKTSSLQCK